MPRIRSLKPELVSDVKLASVSRDARYTFLLMITQADDLGLLAGAHRQLLGTLYPLDEDVTIVVLLAWIEQLVNVGLVRWLSTRDGVPVLQITNWAKHQRIDNAGRSQLGALLAEPDGVSPILAESRREPPRGFDPASDPRGLDHRPPTTDLGSPVIEVSVSDAACVLSRAANRGLAEHPTRPQLMPPIIATGGRTHEATVAIIDAGVPIPFAESAIYELAKTHTSDSPVKSLNFFVAYTKRLWEQHKAAEDVKNSDAPAPIRDKKEHWKDRNERAAREAEEEFERKRILGNVMARRARTSDGEEWWARMQNEVGTNDQLKLYAYAFKHIDEPGTLAEKSA